MRSSVSSQTDPTTGSAAAGISQPLLAGLVAGLVGFTSSFAVVLTGLRAVGASPVEAASGLLVVCVTMGVGSLIFSLRTRMPITFAWSTPGAALLAGAVTPDGGYATAVGAFLVAGMLYLLTGLIKPLARWVKAIPLSLANAMFAGVLLTLCVQPFLALADSPSAVAPVLLTWLVLLRVARRWAVPGAFLASLVVIAATGSLGDVSVAGLAPQLTWTIPAFDLSTMVAIGLPLYLVTMTSQNIPGVAVLKTFGYAAPLRAAMFYTGSATIATAGLGGFSLNFSAITTAFTAGPGAHRDPEQRWLAGISTGATYTLFGPLAAAVAAVAVAAPAGLIAAVAGLALIGSFGSAASAALADDEHREAAALTFVVAASGVTAFGIGAAF